MTRFFALILGLVLTSSFAFGEVHARGTIAPKADTEKMCPVDPDFLLSVDRDLREGINPLAAGKLKPLAASKK